MRLLYLVKDKVILASDSFVILTSSWHSLIEGERAVQWPKMN